jgi:hypothetical protein
LTPWPKGFNIESGAGCPCTVFSDGSHPVDGVGEEDTMNFTEFMTCLNSAKPPDGIPETLASLWWDKKGQWDRAHSIAQDIPTVQGSAVHAYLHREEGVLWNADYWYRRAGRKRPDISLEQEWEQLAQEMLSCDTAQ